ncbi:MAG: UDP-N-acetylglucosamine 4,6-dehydratase (inverting) [Oscillospiraceae bacterium]|nr:UDP-N-acetylglucosamine 4,6-dehydratase (inverting) [Oscillospiraceae bacterium]
MTYTNKSILITGGTGSFGYAFARDLLERTDARRVIIYSRDEYKQFLMQQEFAEHLHRLRFFIGDVRDGARLCRAFNGVNYVIHAAAMKQVPACEYNPMEAVNTNINGAMNVINAALDNDSVTRVIALSTDKAVSPINLYGGTKLVSDKLFAAANSYAGRRSVRFSLVRYGNVAGSRGSVIPFFKQKIEEGCTSLPLTDERMTRFWMTLDKGILLVEKALKLSKGGETFVYKNPSFYVTDLIKAMSDAGEYEVTGIREGEKLHECMITSADAMRTYEYDDYYVIYPNYDWWTIETGIIPGGKRVNSDWEYTSDKNSWWLGVDELRKMAAELER